MKSLYIGVILVLTFHYQNAQAQTRDEIENLLSKHFPDQIWNGVIGMVDSTQSVVFTFGKTTSGAPVTQHSSFYVASLTKSFIGLHILEMIEKGDISSSDTIGKWFPEFSEDIRKTTIAQLANHTAAIHDYYSLSSVSQVYDNEHVIDLIAKLDTTAYEPGHHWGYSNSHYVLLAEIMAKELSVTSAEYLSEYIIKRYKMFDVFGTFEDIQFMLGKDEHGRRLPHTSQTIGDAGLVVSANDLLVFGERLSQDKALTNLIKSAKEIGQTYERDTNWTYSYGWFHSQDNYGRFAAHSGKGDGFQSYHQFRYDDSKYFLIITNRYANEIQPFRIDIVKLLFGD